MNKNTELAKVTLHSRKACSAKTEEARKAKYQKLFKAHHKSLSKVANRISQTIELNPFIKVW